MQQTPFHAYYKARELDSYMSDALIPAYASSSVEVYPYQIAAAQFALRSPYLKGCILGDECSLGKTYEALLIATQKWYEGKNRLLLILPVNMIDQWITKIESSFTLPYSLIDTREAFETAKTEADNPFEQDGLVITTYEFAAQQSDSIKAQTWDLIIFDEADRLNKTHTGDNKTASTLKAASDGSFKLLLTPTPIEMDIRDIYGLIYFIDETVLPESVDEFYNYYFRRPDRYPELAAYVSQFCFRTLKNQVSGYANFTERIPYTIGCDFTKDEKKLYDTLQGYLARPEKLYHAQMNQYDLTLQHDHILSSSPQTYLETIKGVIGRAKKMTVPEDKQDLYNEEMKIFEEIRELAERVKITGKMKMLTTVLKKAFARLRQVKANQKAIIFVNFLDTMDVLKDLLTEQGYTVLIYRGENSRDYSVMKRFRNDDIQILIAKGDVTKGLDIEFCPIVVNYDILSNAPEMEQRISRSHRQGQKSDVLVINLINKDNYADIRYLELINKRVLQFSGIFGMSDTILGNFDADTGDILSTMRNTNEIAAAFETNLSEHATENREIVDDSLDTLFTTFTKEIADKVTVAPQYVEEQVRAANNELWDVVRWYFTRFSDDSGAPLYEIDEIDRTVTLLDERTAPKLFTYKLDRGNLRPKFKPYHSISKYGMNSNFNPYQGRIALASFVGNGIMKTLCCEYEGTIMVDADIENCVIGLYGIIVAPKDSLTYGGKVTDYVFIGQTESGRILTHDECKEIMALPVSDYVEKMREPQHEFDKPSRHTFEDRSFLIAPAPHPLDACVAVDEFVRKRMETQEPALAEQIQNMKRKAAVKKSGLERASEEIKAKMAALQREKTSTAERMKIMRIEKQMNVLGRDLMQKEENLFLDGMKIDVDLENEIKAFVENGSLTGKAHRHYIVEVRGR